MKRIRICDEAEARDKRSRKIDKAYKEKMLTGMDIRLISREKDLKRKRKQFYGEM